MFCHHHLLVPVYRLLYQTMTAKKQNNKQINRSSRNRGYLYMGAMTVMMIKKHFESND